MSQSLSLLYVHLVFHIGNKQKTIRSTELPQLYNYIGGIIKEKESLPIRINGMSDHIHILLILSKNIALANLVRDIKRSSVYWLRRTDVYYEKFVWQKGYGAFSVGVSNYQRVIGYIDNQEKHHEKLGFKDEYINILKASGIEYNEDFLWND